MRLQLICLCLLFSSFALADDDKVIKELFAKYEQVVTEKKVELIDEVFTADFIKDSGGKKELEAKIKEDKVTKKSAPPTITWHKGAKGNRFYAKRIEADKKEHSGSQFIVEQENGKYKIGGTLGDGD